MTGSAVSVDEGLTPLRVLGVLVSHWKVVAGLPVVAVLATGVYCFVARPTFTATAVFVPEARTQSRVPSALAGVAGQLGISLGSEGSQSPRFYADVIKGRTILERTVSARYAGSGDSLTLISFFHRGGRDGADTLARAVRALSRVVAARVDNQTNMLRVSVELTSPRLAADVANRMVEYLNDFNANSRRSQGRTKRMFIESRITESDHDLAAAEQELKQFYEGNREWQRAPKLVLEEGRLRRQMSIQEEVLLTLKREYETARIDEVNDTPVITVIDAAVPPAERSSPNRSLLIILAAVLGFTAAALWANLAEYVERSRAANAADYRGLQEGLRRMSSEIRVPRGAGRGA